eukprot:CAMPEP_0168619716 /NCGR_PEP_ID=MMETSP0449_2-20121227/6751_1 /TAXON_ID=1082188 /ORGANISM="Strombidium rassoulzadegani, Strain ras09" /LENGTH=170 /DNA_ID=CAMNT_0008660671 /DNA_START=268 /DNA_END=780 /DNA_ORIENTATION=+
MALFRGRSLLSSILLRKRALNPEPLDICESLDLASSSACCFLAAKNLVSSDLVSDLLLCLDSAFDSCDLRSSGPEVLAKLRFLLVRVFNPEAPSLDFCSSMMSCESSLNRSRLGNWRVVLPASLRILSLLRLALIELLRGLCFLYLSEPPTSLNMFPPSRSLRGEIRLVL